MTSDIVLEFDRLPSIAPSYVRAVTTFAGGLAASATIPPISATVDGLRVDQRALARYSRVCGFVGQQDLPITYPHVLAFPIHMAVMTHRQFPFKLMGLVHVRNSITQYRAIAAAEPLALRVSVGDHRQVHNGVEFDLSTVVHDTDEQCVWESSSTMLSRGGGTGKRAGSQRKGPKDLADGGSTDPWSVPADIGRRYAKVAGDVNPIHMSALSAKLFGFPRAIAHGMWLKAHAAARMADAVKAERYNVSVAFKKPVLLPAQAQLRYQPSDAGIDFVLQNQRGDITHMVGELAYL